MNVAISLGRREYLSLVETGPPLGSGLCNGLARCLPTFVYECLPVMLNSQLEAMLGWLSSG